MLLHSILSHRSLKPLPFFKFFFLFAAFNEHFLLSRFSNHWFDLLLHLICYWLLLVYFWFQFCIFISDWLFFMVYMSFSMLLKFLLSSLSILIIIVLNSICGRLLASISLSSFSENFFSYFIWGMFFISLFWLPLCICFCVLGTSAMSPSLGRVALCNSCPVAPSKTDSLISRARWPRSVFCVSYVCSPGVEPWLLLAHPAWLAMTTGYNPSVQAAVLWLTPWRGILPSRVWCLPISPLVCATCGTNLGHVMLWPKSSSQVCVFWGLLGQDLSTSQCQMLPVTSPGLPVKSYKAIHSW